MRYSFVPAVNLPPASEGGLWNGSNRVTRLLAASGPAYFPCWAPIGSGPPRAVMAGPETGHYGLGH